MIRFRGTVEYENGETVAFAAGSKILVAWEAYCRRHSIAPVYDESNVQTMQHFIAWAALGIEAGFETWLASVVDVDIPEESPAVDPFLEGASLD